MLGKGDAAGSLHGFIPGGIQGMGRAGAGPVAAGQAPQEWEWQDLALLCFSVCFFFFCHSSNFTHSPL